MPLIFIIHPYEMIIQMKAETSNLNIKIEKMDQQVITPQID